MERTDKLKAFVSWSGGKDAALSCFRAMKDYRITHLLNMAAEDGTVSRSHGIRADILELQAEAMGLPLVQQNCSWESYEGQFKRVVSDLKKEGIRAGIFGDIDLETHREWVERVCGEVGVQAVLPLWGEEREAIIREFMAAGFEAVVVSTRVNMVGSEWLGRAIDGSFIRDISKISGVDLAGEGGEYHTFVTSGPIMKKRIAIRRTEPNRVGEHSFLNITEGELVEKAK